MLYVIPLKTGFLSSTWHITSRGMFAGSCIGVVCLVLLLELLRRLQREHARFVAIKHAGPPTRGLQISSENSSDTLKVSRNPPSTSTSTLTQQAIRATIHLLQFAIAYFIMLLAMYYNGYIIICIFIGAWIGSFLFGWDQLRKGIDSDEVTGCCG